MQEIGNPGQRYFDIVKIFKAGKNAKVDKNLWNLDQCYVEDFIDDSGSNWNFVSHQKTDTKPTLDDFKKTVADYLAWEVSNVIKSEANDSLGK